MAIHPTAIVSPKAQLHETVEVGPFTVIGPNVTIGENTVVGANCNIDGWTTIGSGNRLFPFTAIGCPPQDLKYSGQKTFIKIGNENHFREFTTVHLAEGEGHETVIGDKNLFMAYVHIAHNCRVGSNVIMANFATLAGHVHVGDRAVLGGFAGIHQFCHVGRLVMVGAKAKITKDVPPYIMIDGNPARVIGLNLVGLKRNGVPKESIERIRTFFKVFFRSPLNVTQILQQRAELNQAKDPFVEEFFDFVTQSKRGVYKRRRDSVADREE